MKKLVLLLLIATLFSFLSQQIWAEDTGWLFPTTYRNVINVDNPNLSLSDSGVLSRLGDDDSQIEYGGFGVSIPTSSVISGIEVQLKGAATPTRNLYIELSWNGEDFTNTTYTTNFTSNVLTYSFGSNLDLWGRSSWTATELNNYNFWISINTTASNYGSVYLNYIAVKVYYEVPDLITTFNTPGTYTYKVPAGVTEITAKAWGGGGGGSQSYDDGSLYPGAGGGGGGYITGTFNVSPGDTVDIYVGAGGEGASSINSDGLNGSNSVVEHSSGTIAAIGGRGAKSGAGGGAGGVGDSGSASGYVSNVQGHKGGNGIHGIENSGGGAGGGAGDSTNGLDASGSTGGDGGTASGGKGGDGSTDSSPGGDGSLCGGGGGGASTITGSVAGNGANGQVFISYEPSICIPPSGLVVESNSPVCESGDEDEGEDIELRASVSAGSEPLTYSWTGPNGFTSSFPTAYISSSTSSSGTYTVTVTNACGPVTDSVNVEVIPGPEAGTISGYQTICTGGTAQLSISENSTEGTWGSQNTSVATIDSSGVVTGVAAGEATITYSVSNADGCSDVAEFPITVKIPSEFCHGSAYAVISSTGVVNPDNILGEPDDNVTVLDDYDDEIIIDVTGGPIYTDNYINVRWRDGSQLDGTAHPIVEYYYSQNGTNWFKNYTYTVTSEINFATQQLYFYQVRYLKFRLVQNFDLDIDAITYNCPCIKPPKPGVTVQNNCGSTVLTATEYTGSLLWSTGETTPSITVASNGAYSVTQTVDECTSDATQKTVTILKEPTALAPTVGDGSSEHPYEIATLENLYWITANSSVWDKNFIQTADIVASATAEWCTGGWLPIGNGYADSEEELQVFSGNYNGDGHTISGLYITNSSSSAYGLMGRTKGAFIHDLGVIDVDINLVEYGPVGGLIGYASGSTINNCYSTGNVKGGEDSEVGGLVGALSDTSIILNSYSTCNVNGYYRVGGLAGLNSFSSSITGCSHTSGTVDGNAGSSNFTGGLVGYNYNASLSKCYSTGTVLGYYYTGGLVGGNNDGGTISNCFSKCNCTSSADPTKCGGLVGINQPGSITNCYSTGTVGTDQGGLVAEHGGGEVSNSFWDNVTCDATSSRGGGIGIPTSEMKTESTFTNVGWDFTTIWGLDAGINDGYPFFVPESSCNDGTIILSTAENTDNQSICEDSPITEITYTVGGGADSAKVEGLPNGVNGNFDSGTFTISGTPTEPGTFGYTVTTTGTPSSCNEATTSGTITVNALPEAGNISGNSEISIGDSAQLSATGNSAEGTWESLNPNVATVSNDGLVTGVAADTVTIIYTVNGTGGCSSDIAKFLVTVTEAQAFCDGFAAAVYNYLDGDNNMTPENAIGPSDDKYAAIGHGEYLDLDLTEGLLTLGDTITVYLKAQSSPYPSAYLTQSQDGINWEPILNGYPYVTNTDFVGYKFQVSEGTRYFRIQNVTTSWLYIESVSFTYPCTGCTDGTLTLNTSNNEQSVCQNAVISDIVYSVGGGADSAKVEGLPNGVNGNFDNGSFTISGTPTESGTFNYTVTTTGTPASCSDATASGIISVNAVPNTPYTEAQSFCSGDNAIVHDLVVFKEEGATVNWYDVSEEGVPLSETDALSNGTYYVSQIVNGCESARTSVDVTVNTTPGAPTAEDQSFCNDDKHFLDDLVVDHETDAMLNWYSALVGGGTLSSKTELGTKTYYVSQTVNGCEGPRTAVSVTIDNIPEAGVIEGNNVICEGLTTKLFTDGDTEGSWSSDNEAVAVITVTGEVKGITPGTATISYTVKGKGGCEGTYDVATMSISVVKPPNAGNITGPETLCIDGKAQLTSDGDQNGSWTSLDDDILSVDNTGLVTAVSAGSASISYFVEGAGGCKGDEAIWKITVFSNSVAPSLVTSNPVTTETGDHVCPGDPVNLTVSGGELGTNSDATWTWYVSDCGSGELIGTGESIQVQPTETTTYFVRAEGGCNTTTCASVDVWVWPQTEITGEPGDALIKYGCLTKFDVVANGRDLTYQWYQNNIPSNSGGEPIADATSAEFWPDCSEAGTFYYYVVVTGTCGTATSDVSTLTIDPQAAGASGILYYTGPKFAFTQNENSSTATIMLSATIKNNLAQVCSEFGGLAEAGDIRTALISFEIDKGYGWEKIPEATNLPVNYIDPNDISLGGTAAALAQIDIDDESGISCYLRVVVKGNYTGKPEKMDCPVTIVRPQAGGIITGTVGLCNDNSAGFVKGMTEDEFHTILNFEVKYSDTEKINGADKPKGKVWLLVASSNNSEGIPDGQEHTYLITSNAIADLVINNCMAHFTAKANVVELLEDGVINSLEGNCIMELNLEKGETCDKVGITVYRAKAKGGIWYSNNWSPSGKTLPDCICEPGFEIGGCNPEEAAVSKKTKSVEIEPEVKQPELKVYPNPFSDRLKFEFSSPVNTHVRILMYDITGKLVSTVFDAPVKNGITYHSVFIPESQISGIYIYRIISGDSVSIGKVSYLKY